MNISFTSRELDTVLAALRRHQDKLEDNPPDEDMLKHIAEQNGAPLSTDEIDDLCERLNFASGFNRKSG